MTELREWQKPLSPEKLAWLTEQFRILDMRWNAQPICRRRRNWCDDLIQPRRRRPW